MIGKINLPFFIKSFLINLLLLREHIEIKIAKTEEEKNKAISLVFDIYKKEGYIDLNFFNDFNDFKDEFDDNSVYFLAFLKNNLIGALRIILPSKIGFPSEKFFNYVSLPVDKKDVAEISRLAILNNHRKNIITLGLFKKCLDYSKNKGLKYWCMVVPEKLKSHFEKFKIKFYKFNLDESKNQNQEAIRPHRFYFEKNQPKLYLIELREIETYFIL
ncbi:MAG: GNAT family N-acetyltransferase [Candidatus Paceibacterota bacterium]|jgi:hypothetical protein